MVLLNLIQHQRQLQAREPNHLSSMVSKSRQNRHTRDNQRVGR
ncbi:BnaC09g14280D [Brassica napus]|uniref:BnaC09g14280D protein n=1 Tax=Brassica napus TaxID=3708 RepID=A0A078IAV6_BRANA|nr:BnaC09g14280D [Brassica napus]